MTDPVMARAWSPFDEYYDQKSGIGLTKMHPRDDEVTERRHGYQNYFFLALDTAQNPYYCGSRTHTSAPSYHDGPAWPLHWRTPPVHLPPATEKASALVGVMTSVIANVM
jgi:hypothetical protein